MILDDVALRVKKEFIPPDLFIPISGTSYCSMRAGLGLETNGCSVLVEDEGYSEKLHC